MSMPKVTTATWVMTRTYVDPSDGEEIWSLTPKSGDWYAVIHLQLNGKIYLTLFKGSSPAKRVDQELLSSSLRVFSEELLKRGITPKIGVVASEKNAALFKTVRRAGFKKTSVRFKNKKKPNTILFVYKKSK